MTNKERFQAQFEILDNNGDMIISDRKNEILFQTP